MDVCERAGQIIATDSQQQQGDILSLLSLCESPVEQILLATIYERWHATVDLESKRLQCHLTAEYPAWSGIFTVCCEPQRTIKTWTGEEYRADLYIYLTRFRHHRDGPKGESWPEMATLIVETDGHDFHERTKLQASYDRKRDRNITLHGFRVIRFTGSDVYNDAEFCVEDIDFHVDDLASRVFDDYVKRGKLEELIVG
jgi:hypothetical protein